MTPRRPALVGEVKKAQYEPPKHRDTEESRSDCGIVRYLQQDSAVASMTPDVDQPWDNRFPGWRILCEDGGFLRQALEENGIPSQVAVLGSNHGRNGTQTLWVPAADYERAVVIREEVRKAFDNPPSGWWRCAGCGEQLEASFTTCWHCGRERSDEQVETVRGERREAFGTVGTPTCASGAPVFSTMSGVWMRVGAALALALFAIGFLQVFGLYGSDRLAGLAGVVLGGGLVQLEARHGRKRNAAAFVPHEKRWELWFIGAALVSAIVILR